MSTVTRSAGATPKTGTLNSRDIHFGMNNSTSSGSRTLDMGRSRETVDHDNLDPVNYDDTDNQPVAHSQSSDAITNHRSIDRKTPPSSVNREEKSQGGATCHDEFNYSYYQLSYDGAPANDDNTGAAASAPSGDGSDKQNTLSANQNANDNDDNLSHDSYHLTGSHDSLNCDTDEAVDNPCPNLSSQVNYEELLDNLEQERDLVRGTQEGREEGVGKEDGEGGEPHLHVESQGEELGREEKEGAEEVEGREGSVPIVESCKSNGTNGDQPPGVVAKQPEMLSPTVATETKTTEVTDETLKGSSGEGHVDVISHTGGDTVQKGESFEEWRSNLEERENLQEEIPYILHRRHVNQSNHPPASLKVQPPGGQPLHTSTPLPSKDQVKHQLNQIRISLTSPIVSPNKSPKSPAGTKRAFDFVVFSKLPPKTSFSSQDDSMSPTVEREGFAALRPKQAVACCHDNVKSSKEQQDTAPVTRLAPNASEEDLSSFGDTSVDASQERLEILDGDNVKSVDDVKDVDNKTCVDDVKDVDSKKDADNKKDDNDTDVDSMMDVDHAMNVDNADNKKDVNTDGDVCETEDSGKHDTKECSGEAKNGATGNSVAMTTPPPETSGRDSKMTIVMQEGHTTTQGLDVPTIILRRPSDVDVTSDADNADMNFASDTDNVDANISQPESSKPSRDIPDTTVEPSVESAAATNTSPPGGSNEDDTRKQREFRNAIEEMFKEAVIDSLSSSGSEEVHSDTSSEDLPPPPPLASHDISSEDDVEHPCSIDMRDSSSILASSATSKPYSVPVAAGTHFPAPPYVSSESDVEGPAGGDFGETHEILAASAKACPYSVPVGGLEKFPAPPDISSESSDEAPSDSDFPDASEILRSHVRANPFSVPVSGSMHFPEAYYDRGQENAPGVPPSIPPVALLQAIPVPVELSSSGSEGGCHSDDDLPDAAAILDAEVFDSAVTAETGSDDELPPPPPPNEYSGSEGGEEDESPTKVIDFYNRLGLPEDLTNPTTESRLAVDISSSSGEEDDSVRDDDGDMLAVLESLETSALTRSSSGSDLDSIPQGEHSVTHTLRVDP